MKALVAIQDDDGQVIGTAAFGLEGFVDRSRTERAVCLLNAFDELLKAIIAVPDEEDECSLDD